MTTFKDAKGREWKIALTIGRAQAVLEATGVDLLQPEGGKKALPEILTDDVMVARIICVLLASEFKRLGIDPANMMDEDWDGDTTAGAYNALLEELSVFFVARGQLARANLIRKTNATVLEAMKIMEEEVSAANPAADLRSKFKEEKAKSQTDGNTSGKPPDAPGSTPGL